MNFEHLFSSLVGEYTINEKLALRGSYKFGIYQRLVAATYMGKPTVEQRAVPLYRLLAEKVKRQEKMLSTKYKFKPGQEDPYPSMKAMSKSIDQQRASGVKKPVVKVYADPPGPDGKPAEQGHPELSNDENVSLRGVHDVIAHYFGQHPFSARGEYGAYLRHLKTLGPKLAPVLFTEIVGQTSYYTIYGDFPAQKAVIMDDFDHINVGELNSKSSLNNWFEVENKVMVPVDGFSWDKFKSAFPKLATNLMKGKDFDPKQWEDYDSESDVSTKPTIAKKKK